MAVLTVLCVVAKAESRIKAKPMIRTEPDSYANRASGLPLIYTLIKYRYTSSYIDTRRSSDFSDVIVCKQYPVTYLSRDICKPCACGNYGRFRGNLRQIVAGCLKNVRKTKVVIHQEGRG